MLKLNNPVYLQICEEINKDLNWSYNDEFIEKKNKSHISYTGENQSEIWMLKFYYELDEIGIIKSNNKEVTDEIYYDFLSNEKICNLIGVDYIVDNNGLKNEEDSDDVNQGVDGTLPKVIKKKTSRKKKIKIEDDRIHQKINDNKKLKKNSYIIFPVWFLLSATLIYFDYTWTGWISIIISVLYFLFAQGEPTDYDKVKLYLEELEKDELERIERKKRKKELEEKRKKREKELEEKRKQKELRQLKINQEKTGFKLENTYVTFDKFEGTMIVSTNRDDYTMKHQSSHIYSYSFDMPIFRLTTTNDLWGSVVGVFDDKIRKYYLEFYFASKQWEMGMKYDTSGQPTCESSSLDIVVGSKKFSQNEIIILKNDKDVSQMGKNTCLKVNQNFRFEVDIKFLENMSKKNFEIRFSNFPNVFGKTNNWEFDVDMKNQLKFLIKSFVRDMN